MRTKKQIFQARIRRLAKHRDEPKLPVDAATMLLAEASRLQRLSGSGSGIAQKMAWGMRLSAARLESWCDPAMLTQYQKVKP